MPLMNNHIGYGFDVGMRCQLSVKFLTGQGSLSKEDVRRMTLSHGLAFTQTARFMCNFDGPAGKNCMIRLNSGVHVAGLWWSDLDFYPEGTQ